MKDLLILAVHLLATIAKLVRPGGIRAVAAESLLLKHQLFVSNRAWRRAPNLNSFDRLLLGLGSLVVPPSRIGDLQRFRLSDRAAAQDTAHPREQFEESERLDQVIVRAEFQALDPIFDRVARGKKQHGYDMLLELGDAAPIEKTQEWKERGIENTRFDSRILDDGPQMLAAMPEMKAAPGLFPPPAEVAEISSKATDWKSPRGTSYSLMSAWSHTGRSLRQKHRWPWNAQIAWRCPALSGKGNWTALISGTLLSGVIPRSGMRPLREIAATARRIRASQLHERVEPRRSSTTSAPRSTACCTACRIPSRGSGSFPPTWRTNRAPRSIIWWARPKWRCPEPGTRSTTTVSWNR